MKELLKIGFGGGCHWCTEAVFQAVKGVGEVNQGYISTAQEKEIFYEGVLVYYDPEIISLEKLIELHLQTHQSTSNHCMRSKYLSAVYVFENIQRLKVNFILNELQNNFTEKIITKAYDFGKFKASRKEIRDYYKTDPERPFCQVYIKPKLEKLRKYHASILK
ncbi:peptide-methionine (S)-S-oxide reductase [Christiangramia crocea]|uniref:peptide-methionine (S)-S-oxide reductase n=1 Tax=Christiangramia crocea TaxID=2904124 RepID=A0A9X1UXZ1_9FLAO|nr:peptide-methionine (S)-S-oxide reductase [Gramella crocea]MCG9972372.1 peptide-methionine (S)-S-oxide reductase [Gramella crocea]